MQSFTIMQGNVLCECDCQWRICCAYGLFHQSIWPWGTDEIHDNVQREHRTPKAQKQPGNSRLQSSGTNHSVMTLCPYRKFPFTHIEDIRGNRGKAPLILNFGTRRWWVVSFRGPASSPPINNPCYTINVTLSDRCPVNDKGFTKLYKSVNKCVEQTDCNGACRTAT